MCQDSRQTLLSTSQPDAIQRLPLAPPTWGCSLDVSGLRLILSLGGLRATSVLARPVLDVFSVLPVVSLASARGTAGVARLTRNVWRSVVSASAQHLARLPDRANAPLPQRQCPTFLLGRAERGALLDAQGGMLAQAHAVSNEPRSVQAAVDQPHQDCGTAYQWMSMGLSSSRSLN